MPGVHGPDIAVKCQRGDAKGVEDAIAAGADVLEPVRYWVSTEDGDGELGPPDPRDGIALHQACFYVHVDCVRALLATECYEQLDWTARDGMTPLIYLCRNSADALPPSTRRIADTLPCVELLLEAGAALEPKTTEEVTLRRWAPDGRRLRRVLPSGLTALDFARLSGRSDIVRALEEAASLRYSVQTHRRFPRPARYVAAHSLRLGYQIGSGALLPVWAGRVLPFLVARTSRPEAAEPPDAPPPRKRPAREGPRQSYADQPMRLKPPSCSGISPGTPKRPRVVLPIHLRPS